LYKKKICKKLLSTKKIINTRATKKGKIEKKLRKFLKNFSAMPQGEITAR